MEFTVAIYEARHKKRIHWRTLGLRGLSHFRHGRNPVKLRQRFLIDLKKAFQQADTADMEHLAPTSGLELRRPRLELNLKNGLSGRRYTGRFPIVLASRPASPGRRLVAVYHPFRQDSWFHLDQDGNFEDQVTRFFQHDWKNLDDDQVQAMRMDWTHRLRMLSFNAHPSTLLDQLKKAEPERAHAGGSPARGRRRGLRTLREIGVHETESAADERLKVGRARSPYRHRLGQLLSGQERAAVLLVGAPGVGKTTLIHRWIVDQLTSDGYQVHNNLDKCRQVWRTSGRRLIAGMSHVGEWEQRALEIVEEASSHPVVLWFEDLHAFGRIGRTKESERCLADVFRASLQRREISLVGEMTAAQYQVLEDDAPALATLFTVVHVEEPSTEETLSMLIHEMRQHELDYGIEIEPLALRTLLEHARTLFTAAALPGKALDLLNGLVRRSENDQTQEHLGPESVLALISERTGIPQLLLEPARTLAAEEVESQLRRYVLGQHEAVAAARDIILRIKTGLVDPRRPWGVVLFTGPTGTGKTELAKSMASYLYGGSSRLLRFDMSEYAGPDAASRLIGDRWRPQGLLTTPVREQPFCVVLLDEIEKSHPSVLNLLLQVMGDGRLTDAAGHVADFTHAVIVMTSNLGADGRSRVGFGDQAQRVMRGATEAVKAHFPPELFNRIDRVVTFRPLDPAVAHAIAEIEMRRLLSRRGLIDRQIFVSCTPAVLDRAASEGFDVRQGARSLKRYLDRHIGGLLSELIAGSAGAALRKVRVYAQKSGFALHTEALREAEPVADSSRLEPLLQRSIQDLRAELPAALQFVESLLEGPELERLSAKLNGYLAAYSIGKRGLADRIYNLDTMRERVSHFRDELTRQIEADEPDETEQVEFEHVLPTISYLGRTGLLALLAEVDFIRTALDRFEDADRHAVFLEIDQVAQQEQEERFAMPSDGLLEWLTLSYADERGELEGIAALEKAASPPEVVEKGQPGALRSILDRHPSSVVLKIAGLSVLDIFSGEVGCHLRSHLGGSTEVVRVRVSPASAEVTAGDLLRRRLEAREQFISALEGGRAPLPPNPDDLPPIARRYHYDEPAPGRSAVCEVEDYALCYAGNHRVKSFGQVLTLLRLLHQSVPRGR